MKIKSALITAASGSIGGLTASHNRGGLYFRSRVIPVNPATPQQVAVRDVLAQLAAAWTNTLTEVQRLGWDVYADLVPLPDTLGEPRNVGGLPMYVRSNVPRIQAGLARVDDAPTTYTLGAYTSLSVGNFVAAANTFDVTFVNTDTWAIFDGGGLYILASRPQNASINYFKGPYRFADVVLGNTALPPTSPVTVTSPFPFAVDNRVFVQCRAQFADGRLSAPFRGSGVGA